jgi:hypothetical protein
MSDAPLCLGCGQEVRRNRDHKWATKDGSTTCRGGGEHRVELPDDFRWILDTFAPSMAGWNRRIEVDHDGNWWLVEGTKRRGRRRTTWRPSNEYDAYAVVALLHTLNDCTFVLHPDVHAWVSRNRMSDDAVREKLNVRAYSLLVRHLLL